MNLRFIAGFYFLLLYSISNAQTNNTEFKQFFYPNGQVSSEGYMVNNVPDGLWKAYHVNGELKSIGLRTNTSLDSVWSFYNEKGLITKKINYLNGKKSGYYYTFDIANEFTDSAVSWLNREELFLDNLRHGVSTGYYADGIVKFISHYEKGKQHGIRKEFNEQGLLVNIIQYRYGVEIDREVVNQYRDSLKVGVWKEFYPNGKIKKELNFKSGSLHGLIKSYALDGELLFAHRYINGNLVDTLVEIETSIDIRETFYNKRDTAGNFIKKSSGSFANNKPIGVHRTYDSLGRVNSSKLYNSNGNLIGEGIVDIEGNRVGSWKYYYDSGELRSKGEYSNNRRSGKWIYYYRFGEIEQIGIFSNGRPHGEWNWYFMNGDLRRSENYRFGKEHGFVKEYNEFGDEVVSGEFTNGKKSGSWFYNYNEHVQKGSYLDGQRQGKWVYVFSNGTTYFEGDFVDGRPDGVHKYFFKNGKIRLIENYMLGFKHKNWEYYDYYGSLIKILTFENDELKKINGISVLSKSN